MRRVALIVVLAGCAGGEPNEPEPNETPEPGTETVSVTFDVDMYTPYESPTLPSFDTQGGTRALELMTIAFDHTVTTEVRLRNTSDVDLAEGDYVMDHYFNTLAQLGLTPDDDAPGEGPPFLGPGSFWIQIDDALGPQGSATDTLEETFEETVTFEASYDPAETPEFLEAMTDSGDVTIVIGGFFETFVYFDKSLEGSGVEVEWDLPSIRYAGEITVTYDYVPVAG
ncbi:hypothetical protein L6R50_19295 [Myxococcota bacterium]|nr:hypothetical protein [Myxococcota bacterium]